MIYAINYQTNRYNEDVGTYDVGLGDNYVPYYYNTDYQVLAETDQDGYVLRNFIYGPGLDEVLIMTDPNLGEDYYYLHDHLKSPVAIVDQDGDIVERYEYDAYGKPTFWEGDYSSILEFPACPNPYYFTGRRIDFYGFTVMLQYHRNRFYDYQTGRWLNQDPIGYQDGVNLYAYVNSNPVNKADPRGLRSDEPECADCDPSGEPEPPDGPDGGGGGGGGRYAEAGICFCVEYLILKHLTIITPARKGNTFPIKAPFCGADFTVEIHGSWHTYPSGVKTLPPIINWSEWFTHAPDMEGMPKATSTKHNITTFYPEHPAFVGLDEIQMMYSISDKPGISKPDPKKPQKTHYKTQHLVITIEAQSDPACTRCPKKGPMGGPLYLIKQYHQEWKVLIKSTDLYVLENTFTENPSPNRSYY